MNQIHTGNIISRTFPGRQCNVSTSILDRLSSVESAVSLIIINKPEFLFRDIDAQLGKGYKCPGDKRNRLRRLFFWCFFCVMKTRSLFCFVSKRPSLMGTQSNEKLWQGTTFYVYIHTTTTAKRTMKVIYTHTQHTHSHLYLMGRVRWWREKERRDFTRGNNTAHTHTQSRKERIGGIYKGELWCRTMAAAAAVSSSQPASWCVCSYR